MKNNADNGNDFRNRIANYGLERRVVTQNELEYIAKKFNERIDLYLKDIGIKINIEDILLRCKETIADGEKYILTPQHEEKSNPAGIIPLEEMALLELFKKDGSYNDEVIVLLEGQKAKLKFNNQNSGNRIKTIEISFESVQNENDMQNEFENQF